MTRREFTALFVSVTLWPAGIRAQQPPKSWRIGVVTIQQQTSPPYAAFAARLRELGYTEGENLGLEFLNPDTHARGVEGAVRELVGRKVDVLIAPYESAVKSALAASDTLPIVMIAIDYDPLALGHIKALGRPGRNVTGLFLQQLELAKKRLQLFKEAFPDVHNATMFWDGASKDQWRATANAAAEFGLHVSGIELREQPYDYEKALAQAPPDHRGALIMPTSPIFYRDRQRLADLALQHRAAAMFVLREWVDAGGLLSYGASFPDMFRRAAEYVDRIARGSKAGDLPVQQPTKFELVINLKTAKALGLTLPPSLLARADEVIE
jgi:putative tryptophan/tyrosine transport system substrate-binding protein